MRKLLLILAFSFFLPFMSQGQYYIDYGFSVGASNYLGEIGGGEGTRRDGFVDMKLNYSRWTIGGFYRYRVSNKIGVRGALNYIRISGDDSKTDNPARRARNLNFKNDMFELLALGELYVYKVNDVGRTGRYSTDFNLYFLAGVGLFYSNPKGQDVNSGQWVAMKDIQSEGVSYSSFNLAIPLGIGFYYTIDRKYRLGMEVSWRTTFTDYIDDVSTVYTTNYDGLTNKTTPELINEINDDDVYVQTYNYIPGSKRGDPEHDDAYLTATVNFSWAIRGRSNFYRAKHSWVLGRKKRRRRKSRAKF